MANFTVVKSPLGALKILLVALLVTIVILAKFGNGGHRLSFGLEDFLGVGASVGFAIVLPLILFTYVLEGNILILEALLSSLGSGLFIAIGVITLDSYDHPKYGSPAGKALAGLCISTGIIFVINLILVFRAMKNR